MHPHTGYMRHLSQNRRAFGVRVTPVGGEIILSGRGYLAERTRSLPALTRQLDP